MHLYDIAIKLFLTGSFWSASVVEFRTEELMKKAVEKVNKHNLNGRPLKVKEVRTPQKQFAQLRPPAKWSLICIFLFRTPMV